MSEANNASVMTEVTTLLRSWEEEHSQPNYDPVPTLTRLAEIIEIETENYLKMDPDPFDERHPSRTDPECKLGQILKTLFRKDNFSNKLVNDYLRETYYSRLNINKNVDQLNIAACRLMLDIMPGLETSVVFQSEMDTLINRLIKWATHSIEPLQSYATGLLAAAMELPEIAPKFREQNAKLIPLMLQRLRKLRTTSEIVANLESDNVRPFAHLSSMKSPPYMSDSGATPSPLKRHRENGAEEHESPREKRKKIEEDNSIATYDGSPQKGVFSEASNSSWAELETFMIGTVQIFPPTIATRQILILRYLTPLGEYQEFLSKVLENNTLELILSFVNVRQTKQSRLAFEALKYLASLLCHKKFSTDFVQFRGIEALLEVPRPSIAATGVSMCLYYLSYSEDAMERVCLLPKYIVSNLVKYALWLLECSHDSGRCHTIMFFGLTFQFKVILDEFDSQDGLRKLHNVIATLPILLQDEVGTLNEDQECAARQMVRHVCVAFRKYMEAHLIAKVESIRRNQLRPADKGAGLLLPAQPSYKASKSSPEEIEQQIETLLQYMPFKSHWHPVEYLLKLDCVTLLLKIIAFAYEWNYGGRAETVRSALDTLAIASVMPKVQVRFCERVEIPDESVTVGINIILGAAEGEIVADAEVQKAALRVICTCVCGPINRVGTGVGRFSLNTTCSPNKKGKLKSSEELIQRVWDCVRSNSGIMVLMQLMNIKTPITDADCIRTLACKALAGLARSNTVQQIVSKLPLFTSGQMQSLMRDPILQEKRQEHVAFQKYALELLQLLSGQTKHAGHDLEVSLFNIHRANVVAQTKIQYMDKQLLQLIHQHLVNKGYSETANLLVKEANLSHSIVSLSAQHPTKFRYTAVTPSRSRLSSSSYRPTTSVNQSTELVSATTTTTSPAIKIIKKSQSSHSTPISNCRLQKQISAEHYPHPRVPTIPSLEDNPTAEPPRVTLDSIITEYLANQHALCKNPMSTCPPFNLFVPHKCPDPKPRIMTANNFTLRCARRAIGYQSKTMDRRFVHSRFCPVQTIRSMNEEGFFTNVKFLNDDRTMVVGGYNGDVHIYNVHTGAEESNFQAHDNYIVHLEPNRTGELLLTSMTWGRPNSALWGLKDFDMKMPFIDEQYVEFSKTKQDKVIGTKNEIATIYDISSKTSILNLTPTNSNQYPKNKATFSYNDELVLSDGVLYDVNSGKQIHKLDKLNQMQSGVFHPNGLEIVSNTEVWDMRTFHLLKTVPILNQCQVVFSPEKSTIYAFSMEHEMDDGDPRFESSFKTVDGIDYTSIATIDVKRNIYDLAVNSFDTQIAIVENQGMYQSVHESVVRVYDVGRRRDDEDEQDEEEDDEDDDDDLDGSDGSSASDTEDAVVIDLQGNNIENDNNENNDDNDDDSGSDFEESLFSSDESWASMSSVDSSVYLV